MKTLWQPWLTGKQARLRWREQRARQHAPQQREVELMGQLAGRSDVLHDD